MEAILKAFYEQQPNASVPQERVAFGTSGHRGRSIERTFNAAHIYAITQAVVDYRLEAGYQGPLFLGFDTCAFAPRLGVRTAGAGRQSGAGICRERSRLYRHTTD